MKEQASVSVSADGNTVTFVTAPRQTPQKVKTKEVLNNISEEQLTELRNAQPEQVVLDQVQFFHLPQYGRTYGVVPPSKDSVLEAMRRTVHLEGANTVTLMIGRAKLKQKDNDQYVKEYGRLICGSKLQAEEFKLESAYISGDKIDFVLSRGNERLTFFVRHDRDVPFLTDAEDKTANFYNYAKKPGKTAYNFGRTYRGGRF